MHLVLREECWREWFSEALSLLESDTNVGQVWELRRPNLQHEGAFFLVLAHWLRTKIVLFTLFISTMVASEMSNAKINWFSDFSFLWNNDESFLALWLFVCSSINQNSLLLLHDQQTKVICALSFTQFFYDHATKLLCRFAPVTTDNRFYFF